jgi:hypothetical protein
MNGILEQAGVAESLRAAWLGHTVAVNKTAYMPKPKGPDAGQRRDRPDFRGPCFKSVTKPGPA